MVAESQDERTSSPMLLSMLMSLTFVWMKWVLFLSFPDSAQSRNRLVRRCRSERECNSASKTISMYVRYEKNAYETVVAVGRNLQKTAAASESDTMKKIL